MWLIVGLGNPGREYEGNRHNVGFMAVDEIASEYHAGAWKSKFQGLICEANIEGTRVYLLKPQTFMNLSGQSVKAAASFYKIPPEKVIVLHDELDLPPFKVRVKLGGGHAGHNGLKSIDAQLGSRDYWRVRLGIGHPGRPEAVSHYVLSDFAKADANMLDELRENISRHLGLMILGKTDEFTRQMADTK